MNLKNKLTIMGKFKKIHESISGSCISINGVNNLEPKIDFKYNFIVL